MYSSTCILIYVWKGQKDNSQQFKSQSQISFGAFKFSSKTVKVLCYTSAWIKKKKNNSKKNQASDGQCSTFVYYVNLTVMADRQWCI